MLVLWTSVGPREAAACWASWKHISQLRQLEMLCTRSSPCRMAVFQLVDSQPPGLQVWIKLVHLVLAFYLFSVSLFVCLCSDANCYFTTTSGGIWEKVVKEIELFLLFSTDSWNDKLHNAEKNIQILWGGSSVSIWIRSFLHNVWILQLEAECRLHRTWSEHWSGRHRGEHRQSSCRWSMFPWNKKMSSCSCDKIQMVLLSISILTTRCFRLFRFTWSGANLTYPPQNCSWWDLTGCTSLLGRKSLCILLSTVNRWKCGLTSFRPSTLRQVSSFAQCAEPFACSVCCIGQLVFSSPAPAKASGEQTVSTNGSFFVNLQVRWQFTPVGSNQIKRQRLVQTSWVHSSR